MIKKRVAVLGAGPSGLSALVAFQTALEELDDNETYDFPEVVCFEKQADWGGIWQYTDMTGLDAYGEPVHTSMYRKLFINGPKECLELPDYTFDDHFGMPIGSYPPRPVMLDYISGRAEKAGVRKWCRFQTPVRHVQFNNDNGKFAVTVQDLPKDHTYTEEFDYVICATGHFSTPYRPEFEGASTYTGRILHAHDFRDAYQFSGQNVLVVGGSYSAEDIGSQCWKYGANSITVSTRSGPMEYEWPTTRGSWRTKPEIAKIEGAVIQFIDGSQLTDIDAIILCTGYQHYFPFLADDALRLKTTNRMWVPNLYKGVVWQQNPQLFYVGMQDQFYTFTMFDAQAWYVRDIILGRLTLPDSSEMQKDSDRWLAREEKLVTDHDQIYFQGDYVEELVAATDYPNLPIKAINETFEEWEHLKAKSFMGYRDNAHKSLLTGTMGAMPNKLWVDQADDSLQTFLTDVQVPEEKKAD